MLEVAYGREAANYLEDNGSLVAELFFAMEELADTAGWPAVGEFHEIDGLVHWIVLRHLVIYRRFEQ